MRNASIDLESIGPDGVLMTRDASKRMILLAMAISAVTLVAYLPSLRNGFIWDDDHYVTQNAELHDVHGLASIWLEPGAKSHLYDQYYPLVLTTFWIEHHLFGNDAFGYHLVNVLLHALVAILLWRVLRRLAVPGALFAALLFALHPVHVETVDWISETKNLQSSAFYLASALALISFMGLDASRQDTAGDRRAYSFAFVFFVCALLSKTVTCTLPAALLLVVGWKRGRITARDVLSLLPFFVVGIALGLTTAWLERVKVNAVGPEWDFSFIERVLIASRAICFYAAKLFWPHDLTFVYERWRIDASDLGAWARLVGVALAILAVFVLRRSIGRGALVALLFFAGTLFPALGFFNVYPMRFSFVADHFQYLASIGLIVLFAATTTRFLFARGERAFLVGATLLLGTLGALTWRQTSIYADPETLWRDTISKNPSAWMAHNNLGILLAQQGKTQEAITQFEATLALHPNHAKAERNLGHALFESQRLADAIPHYEAAVRIDPLYAEGHANLAFALAQAGRGSDAIAHYERSLALAPLDAMSESALASLLLQSGRDRDAVAHLEQAARLMPDSIVTLNSFAWFLATHPDAALRDGKRARDVAESACRLSSRKNPLCLGTLAAAQAECGDFEKAIATADEAIAIARAAHQDSIEASLTQHSNAYRARTPWRQATRGSGK